MQVEGGTTDVTTYFALRLTATGQAATGLTITDFDLQYARSGDTPAAKVDATALAAANSAHADNKAIEVDATDQPGLYRVDWPDAAFAAGAREAVLTVKVATVFTEHLAVQIDAPVDVAKVDGDATAAANLNSACDNYSATRGLTGTALPAAAADAGGGVPVSDAGGLDLDAKLANTNEVTAARMGALTDWINDGRLDLLLDDVLARLPAALASGRMSSDAVALSGSTDAADRLEASAATIKEGTAKAGTLSTTQMSTTLSEANDVFNGRILIFKADTTTAALRLQATDITDFVNTNGVLTFTAVTTAPAATETFVIV